MSEATSNVVPLQQATTFDVRAQLHALMSADRALTQSQLAKELGISPSAINQWIKGTYAGDNESIDQKVGLWIESFHAKKAANELMPSAPDWVATPTAQRIIGALSYAHAAADIALIYGGAGISKTSTIRQYVRTSLNVWHVTMTPAMSSVVTALEEICSTLGLSESGGAAKLHRAITRKVRGTGGLLVIDEAQHLSTAALDQIRSIHDATEIGLALVGNQEVYARMTGGNRAAYLDRLHSRVGKRLSLGKPTEADVSALIDAWRIDDAKCRKTLLDIARQSGALRTLTKVLRLASMHALAEKAPVCCTHVGKAWKELGGAE